MQRILLLSVLVVFSISVYGSETCEREKKAVDYWNDQLKAKSTEFGRDKHRAAKKVFLDCLREEKKKGKQRQKNIQKTKPHTLQPAKTFKPVTSTAKRYKKNNKKNRSSMSTSNIRVSEYTNFTGTKLKRWREFYKESDVCLKNRGDMSIFVKCAEERKARLNEFNRRWDEQHQKLKPMLD